MKFKEDVSFQNDGRIMQYFIPKNRKMNKSHSSKNTYPIKEGGVTYSEGMFTTIL
jgi:hypothetical protein